MAFTDADLAAIAKLYPGQFAVYLLRQNRLDTLYASPSLPQISGMSARDYQALTEPDASQIILEADRPLVASSMLKLANGALEEDITYRIRHAEKDFVWVRAQARVVGERDGRPVVIVVFHDVSGESDEQAMLLDHADEIIYVVDRQTYELLYANDAALRWKGKRALCGQPCYRAMNGLDDRCPWCFVPKMKNGFIHFDEANVPGTDMWLRIDCHAVEWHGRAAAAVFSSDISNIKHRQEHLEVDRDTLSMIVDNLPVGIGVSEMREGKIINSITNDRIRNLLDADSEGFPTIDSAIAGRVHSSDKEKLASQLASLTKPGASITGEFRYLPSDAADYRWYRVLARSIEHHDETMVFACMSDMTIERQASEGEAKNRQMYEQAVEEAKLAVWEYDIPAHRVTMSRSRYTEHDYRKFDLPQVTENVPEALLPYIDEGSVDDFLEMYRQVDAGAPHASCEVWYKIKPGQEPRCERISYTTSFDVDGNPAVAFGLGQNITARKLEEEKFDRMYAELAQANPDSLGSFRINLTKNTCSDGQSPIPAVLEQGRSGTADGYLEANALIVLEGPARDRFRARFNRQAVIEAFKNGRTRLSMEYPVCFSNGEYHWLEGVMTIAQNPSTGDVEAITYATDITDRVVDRAIAARIAEQGYDFIGIINPRRETFEIRSAKAVYDLLELRRDYPYEESVDRLIEAHVAADDRASVRSGAHLQDLLEALSAEGVRTLSYRSGGIAGDQMRKQIRASWLDELHREILVVQTDVTATYRRERERIMELESERRAHQHTNALLQSILDAAPTAMFWKDAERRFEGANRAFLDFYGFDSLQAILGKTDEDMNWHPQPDPFENDEKRVIEEGVSTHRVQGVCLVDGVEHHIVASKSPRREGGEIVGLVGAFEDVTREFKRTEQIAELNDNLRIALDEAERANAAEQSFLSNVSHDMRTPLNGILGFTDLALNASDQQVQRDYLGKIEASGRLMLDLVNDVLDMSKIESGKMELHPQSFATRGLFSSIVDAVRLSAEQQGVKLISHLDTSYPLYISVDRLRLQQIVLNLLSNAIKYTPEGGTVEFEVRKIAEDTRGCNTLVRVADTGIGMSAEFQKRMFEPFSQEHQSRMYGMQGTGLGLAIVRNIVELMDGFIEVDSALAEGTAISVYLPIVAVQTGEDPAPANVSSRSIAGKRILLCEDNDLNAEIAEVVLRERGHAQVDRARDGKQGVRLFEASAPGSYDAVLMDLRMPVMDGIDATRAIRALDRPDARRVPILAMTADAFAEDAQRCLAAGMNAHLSKPLDPKRLIDALSQMCNGGDA